MNYINIAYLADINKHQEFFGKNLMAKSRYFISKNLSALPVYKAGYLYDERLEPKAYLIGVNPKNIEPEELWDSIYNLCNKLGANHIAIGEVAYPPNESLSKDFYIYSGDELRYYSSVNNAFASGLLSDDKQVVVFVSSDTFYDELFYLCDKLKYITLFGISLSEMRQMADKMFNYNGTAVLCASSLAAVKLCKAAIVLNENCAKRMTLLLKDMDVVCIGENENTKTLMYTDGLGNFNANASYKEACGISEGEN